MSTVLAIVGFEAASVAAVRARDPERNVVRATMLGTALTGALYIVVCTRILFALQAPVRIGIVRRQIGMVGCHQPPSANGTGR